MAKNVEIVACPMCWDWLEPGTRVSCSNPKCPHRNQGQLKRYSIPPERMRDLYDLAIAARGLRTDAQPKSLAEFEVKEEK